MTDQYLLKANGARRPCSLTDHELLRQFVGSRDETAFAELVMRHGSLVLGVCRRVLCNDCDAEDAFQATFLVLARKAKSIRRRSSLSSWLYKVAYRVALKARTMIAHRREQQLRAEMARDRESLEEVTLRDARAALDEELSRLPEKYRAPLVLCCLEGMTREEAAHQLGCTVGAIQGKLRRGRQRLVRALALKGVVFSLAVLAIQQSQAAAATVSGSLVASTASAAVPFAAGSAAGTGVSSTAVTLAQGAMNTMSFTALKCAAAVLFLAATAAVATQLTPDQAPAAYQGGSSRTIVLMPATPAPADEEAFVEMPAMFTAATALPTAEGDDRRSGRPGRPQVYATFKAADPAQNVLFATTIREGEGKQEHTWDVERDAEIMVDGKPGKVTDLAEGCSLRLWFSDQGRTRISGLEAEGPELGHRMHGQAITAVDADQHTITLRVGERPDAVEVREIPPHVVVTINGEPARLADVTLDRRTWLRLSAKDLKTIAAIRQTARQRAKGEGER